LSYAWTTDTDCFGASIENSSTSVLMFPTPHIL
jgi:hypothetical protein